MITRYNFFLKRWRSLTLLLPVLIAGPLLEGCVTYQIVKSLEGTDIAEPGDELQVEKTTLEDALALLGAPTTVVELEGRDLLIYQQIVMRQKRLAVGLPLLDTSGTSINFSASRGRANYDTLTLFFTPDGILKQVVFEKGTSKPYQRSKTK